MKVLKKDQIKMLIKIARTYNYIYDCTNSDCYAINRDQLIFRIRNEIKKYKEKESEITHIIAA